MSFRRRNRRNGEIDLEDVLSFLQTILCMSVGVTTLTIIGMILSAYEKQNLVLYQMTLAVNVILLIIGSFALRRLKTKNKKLKEKKENLKYE